jgi:two-component system sensor histidine kinase HydH
MLRQSIARVGPLAVALLMGAALVGSAAVNYRDARVSAVAIAEQQGQHIWLTLRRPPGVQLTRDDLQRALDAHEVLYLALWTDGQRLHEVGTSAFPDLPPTPEQVQTAPGRRRMTFPVFGGPPRRRPDEERPLGSPGRPRSSIVIEFEPIASFELQRRALAGLWLASGAAALLATAALVLWQIGRRAERMQGELARQKHLATLGAMSAVLAHELRNPLASLKGHAQLLAEKVEDPKTGARVQRVVDEALRLESLMNDLLEFVRSGAVHPTASSPLEVLNAAVGTTKPERIEVAAAGAPERWSLDGARMQQVLINLLDNALAVTPDGAKVSASVAADGGELVYAVRDHGPGVPVPERARIFEPFHTTKIRGTGLGLAVARRIVELHGGRIEVDDAPGGGALFRVRLPRAA